MRSVSVTLTFLRPATMCWIQVLEGVLDIRPDSAIIKGMSLLYGQAVEVKTQTDLRRGYASRSSHVFLGLHASGHDTLGHRAIADWGVK